MKISELFEDLSPAVREIRALRALIPMIELNLKITSRATSVDIDAEKKEVEWIARGGALIDSEGIAKNIAGFLKKKGFEGWTVKVASREALHHWNSAKS